LQVYARWFAVQIAELTSRLLAWGFRMHLLVRWCDETFWGLARSKFLLAQ
jgi:hypothetical protein